jgi:hypothetical protein
MVESSKSEGFYGTDSVRMRTPRRPPLELLVKHSTSTIVPYAPMFYFTGSQVSHRAAVITTEQYLQPANVQPDSVAIGMWIENNASFFRPLFQQLEKIADTSQRWTRRETDIPAAVAIDNARAVLSRLQARNVRPQRIIPTAEGGIGIIFETRTRYADFEFANSGAATRVFSDKRGNVEAKAIDLSFEGQNATITDVNEFLKK